MDIKDNNITVYERITILIPKVKELENQEIKKNLTFKLRKAMDDIKELKVKYDNLQSNVDSSFFQEKEKVELIVSSILDEIENVLKLTDSNNIEEEPKLIR